MGKFVFKVQDVSEKDHHKTFIDFVKKCHPTLFPLLFHFVQEIPFASIVLQYQSQAFWKTMNDLKNKGFRKGALDIFLMLPSDKYHGFWLELKSKGKKPSEAQQEFIKLANKNGYYATYSDCLDNSINIFNSYIQGKL